jgi:hypothetical protein
MVRPRAATTIFLNRRKRSERSEITDERRIKFCPIVHRFLCYLLFRYFSPTGLVVTLFVLSFSESSVLSVVHPSLIA